MLWGKIIGCLFGLLLTRGNIFGGLLGLWIGHLFDKGLKQQLRGGFNFNHPRHQAIQQQFFKATFLVMGHIAKSDGRVTAEEINSARSIMQRMKLTAAQKKQAITYFTQGKHADFDLASTLHDLRQALQQQKLLLHMFIDIQHQAAEAEGVPSRQKQQLLAHICVQLGFHPHYEYRSQQRQQRRHRQQHSYQHGPFAHKPENKLKDAYQILELDESASDRDVKRAYRKLMSQNHPDKLIAKGLPEEMIRLATDKTQKIRAAYDTICAARGIK